MVLKNYVENLLTLIFHFAIIKSFPNNKCKFQQDKKLNNMDL